MVELDVVLFILSDETKLVNMNLKNDFRCKWCGAQTLQSQPDNHNHWQRQPRVVTPDEMDKKQASVCGLLHEVLATNSKLQWHCNLWDWAWGKKPFCTSGH